MTRRLRIDDLTDLSVPEQPALSPDGAQLAYVLRTTDRAADRTLRNLWRVAVSGGEPQQLTRGDGDSSPTWSPDGTQLAFLRGKDGPAQLWVLPAGGGEPEQLTTLPLGAGAPRWSPDGTRIAFSAPVDIAALAGEDDKAREDRGHAPIVTERLDYQADGAGWLRTYRKHVHLLDVGDEEVPAGDRGRLARGRPGLVAGRDQGSRSARARRPTPTSIPTAPAYVLDATDEKAAPQEVGLTEGLAGPVRGPRRRVPADRRQRDRAGGTRWAAPALAGRRRRREPGRRRSIAT